MAAEPALAPALALALAVAPTLAPTVAPTLAPTPPAATSKKTLIGTVEKTALFVALDILMVLLFTYVWFTHVDRHHHPAATSLRFTAAMQAFFFLYYVAFDFAWERFYA